MRGLQEAGALQKAGKISEAQKKLDEAAAELGRPESEKKTNGNRNSPEPAEKNRDDQKSSGRSAPEKSPEEREKERANAQKLELLDDEAGALREFMRHRRNLRRPQVEKDW